MSSPENQKGGRASGSLARILTGDGAIRKFSTESGISAVTLRSIAATGSVNSYVTAVAIERATGGEIQADTITTEQTKGAELYRREPARSLLYRSFDDGVPISRLLGRYGLTPGDLWNFMNTPPGIYERSKAKVRSALHHLDLNSSLEEPQ